MGLFGKRAAVLAVALVVTCRAAGVNEPETVRGWTAPPYWVPPAAAVDPEPRGAPLATGEPLAIAALPTAPLPFVAVAPCRMADTRGNGFTGAYGPPRLITWTPRTFPVAGQCGVPVSAQAVSANVTAVLPDAAGWVAFYPSETNWPGISNINFVAGDVIANTAVIPLGTSKGLTVLQSAGLDIVIDVNGYYAPQNIVNTLNALTGNVTLAEGTNVTITPGAGSLTIASTPGTHTHAAGDITSGTLASGRLGGTYSSQLNLTNIANVLAGESLTLKGNLVLDPNSRIMMNTSLFSHATGTANIFAGPGAGNTTMIAIRSSGFGVSALRSLTTGNSNTAVGAQALTEVASGGENTAVGSYTLSATTSASGNTAVGASALMADTSGTRNVAVGWHTLASNTTSSDNTAVGYGALDSSTGGTNTALGALALGALTAGTGNVAVGFEALTSASTTFNMTALGNQALRANTTGYGNTGLGYGALGANTTGHYNVSVGGGSLFALTDGNENTVVGHNAMVSAVSSSQCVAVGENALNNSSGSNNTAIGYTALSSLSAGESNTAIGDHAGSLLNTGSSNIYVGHVGSASENSTTRIGSGQARAFVSGIYSVTATGGSAVYVNSSGQLGTAVSSRRYKREIGDVDGASDVLMSLRPVAFRYTPDRDPAGERQYGLIAEEVAEVAPDLVVYGEDGQPETVKYHLVNALLLDRVQKQEREIAAQRLSIEALQAQLARLERLVQARAR